MSKSFHTVLFASLLALLGCSVQAQKPAVFVGEWRVIAGPLRGKPLSISHQSGDTYTVKTDSGAFSAVALGRSLGYYSAHQQGLWTYSLTDDNHIVLTVKYEHDLAGAMKPLKFERVGPAVKPVNGSDPVTAVKTGSGYYLKNVHGVLLGPYAEIHKLRDGNFLIRALTDYRLADSTGKYLPGQPFTAIKTSANGISAKRGEKWIQLGPEARP